MKTLSGLPVSGINEKPGLTVFSEYVESVFPQICAEKAADARRTNKKSALICVFFLRKSAGKNS